MSDLVKTNCPPTIGEFGEQCYILPEDYDPFFNSASLGTKACPESMGEESCDKILHAKDEGNDGGDEDSMVSRWKDGKFKSGFTGLGLGYYGSSELVDGEKVHRWHGLGVNASFSHEKLIWGIANLTLSVDTNLGFGGGVEVNGGLGPTFSIGLPAIVRGWGALKVRGHASSDSNGESLAGWGLNPEAGLSVFFVDFRWVFPSFAGGGESQQGHSFFAGVSIGLP